MQYCFDFCSNGDCGYSLNSLYKAVLTRKCNLCLEQMSRVVRKPFFFFAYAKTKMQISFAVTREADQRLCFRYTDSTIPLLSKSEISSL